MLLIFIFFLFYCRLMVHITDTRAQKVVSYTSVPNNWNSVCTWPALGGAKQFILTTAASSFTRAQQMDNHTVGHYTTGVSSCPTLRGSKHFPSTSHFLLCLVCTQCPNIFTTQKQYWWDANTETTHEQLLHSVSAIQERWIIEEKWRFVKSIRHLKRSNKKVGWRCASYKKLIQVVSQHSIKGPDTMANLVWANTNISGYVMHNLIGIITCNT